MLFKMKAIRAYPGISKCMRPPHTTLDFGVMSFAKALDPNSSLTCLMSCSFQAWAHHSQSNNPPQVPPMLAMQRQIAMIQAWSKKGESFCGKDPLPTFELAKATKYLLINFPNLPFSNVFKSKEVASNATLLDNTSCCEFSLPISVSWLGLRIPTHLPGVVGLRTGLEMCKL